MVTEYRKASHGQGIVDRFLEGYGWHGRHHLPKVEVVSLYVDQKPKGDLSTERAGRHHELKLYPTIAEALTRGGKTLAVDGVLLIGEHGRYKRNARGQTLYPRFEFFQQIVEVFRRTGRSVPVFNDKHLSWNWDWAKTMVDTAHELGFPFMAGSSLPVTWRIPSVDVPWGADLDEVVCVGYGGIDSYDFHGLETLQCMAERRRGGETGVAAVRALRGEPVWKALAEDSWTRGGCSRELVRGLPLPQLHPGLASQGIWPRASRAGADAEARPRPGALPDRVCRWAERHAADALRPGQRLHRRRFHEGTRTTSSRRRCTCPACIQGRRLPNFFSPLAHHIETMFLTGKPPYPVERTLLTTGILAAAIDSLTQEQKRIETPHLRKVALPVAPRIDFPEELSRCEPVTAEPASPPGQPASSRPRKPLAIITTVWRYLSHAQHMGDRFLVGYPYEGRWHQPRFEVAALYVDQKPDDDQSAERAASFGFKVYPTIAQALRRGGAKLAVDGVLIIGEHGDYPRNDKGQILYPRYEFFRQVADVFEADGRAVPVFNDKHLSYSFTKAKAMVDDVEAPGLPVPGRLVAAGDLAAASRRASRWVARSKTPSWSAWGDPTRWTFMLWKPSSA